MRRRGWPMIAMVTAAAQERRPPVELGAGLSALATTPYEDFFTNEMPAPTVDVRLTVPVSPRFSAEAIATAGRRSTRYFTRTEGLYIFQLTQRLRSATRGHFHAFLSYGLAGYYARVSQPDLPIQQQNGDVVIWPAFRYTEWHAPLATVVGGGAQYVWSKRIAVRGDGQLVSLLFLPLRSRWSGSVSIALGR